MTETITKTEKKRLADELREQKRKLIEQMNARIAKADALDAARERKADTRRKILIGACYLADLRAGGPTAEAVRSRLDDYIKDDRDRQLLGLPVTDAAAQ